MAFSLGRLLLIGAIALGLAPGTLVRTHYDQAPQDITITVTPLAHRSGVHGQLVITGAWQLSASNPFFGGFSALVDNSEPGENSALLAGSDKGWTLDIPLASGAPVSERMQFTHFSRRPNSFSEMADMEAMARDRDTGTLWTAYEGFNAVQRDRADGQSARIAPDQMRGWSANSGPETMVRLADGRFIILAEAPEGAGHETGGRATRPGLLFASDPIAAPAPTEFWVLTPPKYSPVDATALPDGSVLILLRRLQITIPATFDSAIMRANPEDIEPGGIWSGEIIANLDGPLYGENFEGIAYIPAPEPAPAPEASGRGDHGAIYIISDDNLSVFQRSLIVRLEWPDRPASGAE